MDAIGERTGPFPRIVPLEQGDILGANYRRLTDPAPRQAAVRPESNNACP